jgi:hypothetical protein
MLQKTHFADCLHPRGSLLYNATANSVKELKRSREEHFSSIALTSFKLNALHGKSAVLPTTLSATANAGYTFSLRVSSDQSLLSLLINENKTLEEEVETVTTRRLRGRHEPSTAATCAHSQAQ